jgi:SAM-dependent methyltransferase
MTLENAPRNIQRLLSDRELAADKPISLEVGHCDECGFVQLLEELESDYYDDYLMTTSHSPQMRAYQREQAGAFVATFALASKRVIEVGCGDGNYLTCLLQAGAQAVGVEPSAKARSIALGKGLEVSGGYLGREHPADGSPYDGFVTRQVLEHVADINGFLQGIRQSLKPGGAGLVEVPSLEKALEAGRFYDFFPDHLNYFSALTLRHALHRNSFEVIDVSPGMQGEYNVALVRKASTPDLGALAQARNNTVHALDCFLTDQRNRGRRVAAWGAGGKGNMLLAVARAHDVAYVIDSDPGKQGRFTPVSHIPIAPPETLLRDPVDAIVLTALAYRDEILSQLRGGLAFHGEVVILGEDLQ